MKTKQKQYFLYNKLTQFIILILSSFCFLGLMNFNYRLGYQFIYSHEGVLATYLSTASLYLFGVLAYPLSLFFIMNSFAHLFCREGTSLDLPKQRVLYLGIFTISLSILLNILSDICPNISYIFRSWCPSSEITIYSAFEQNAIIHCLGGLITSFALHNKAMSLYNVFGLQGTILTFISLLMFSCYKTIYAKSNCTTNILPAIPLVTSSMLKNKLINSAAGRILCSQQKFKNNKISIDKLRNSNCEGVLKKNGTSVDCTENKPSYLIEYKKIILDTLNSFTIEAEIGETYTGSSFSLFEIKVPPGIKVQKIKQLSENIALRLKVESVRIISPVKGTDSIGIEVTNDIVTSVSFFDALQSFLETKQNGVLTEKLPLILGKDVYNETISCDMCQLPHLLIAGTTGSGKSVCINTLLTSIITLTSPEQTKIILIDPKMVELIQYNSCPHIIADVITDVREAFYAFKWLNDEMENRYEKLKISESRNLEAYNQKQSNGFLCRIVCIVDEFNDLLMRSDMDIESMIIKLAQKSRAVGIHLIMATQRPSREVVTGLIKANFPARIAFKVANRFDSQIILDEQGAECLCGNGDMFMSGIGGKPGLTRLQGCYLNDMEVEECIENVKKAFGGQEKLCDHFSSLYPQDTESSGLAQIDDDPLFEKSIEIAKTQGYLSATLLQRHLKIGYPRAAGLIDCLVKRSIISEPNSHRIREYLGK